ncbi:MAG: endonuclease/exonuclease/phosphatase family protein [Leeuwenhoekiella sp.]
MGKIILKRILWLGCVGLITFTIIPNVFPDFWIFDLFAHFKLQYIFLAILLLIPVFTIRKYRGIAIGLLLISIFWNGYYIYPYYFTSNETIEKSTPDLKISSINLLSSNTNFRATEAYILNENPDILILIEFNNNWQKNLEKILKNYPYKNLLPRNDNFGIAVLSKVDMKMSIEYFGKNSTPSILGNFSISNKKVSLLATHPEPPLSQKNLEIRDSQLQAIKDLYKNKQEYFVMAGDFNTSSFSNVFGRLTAESIKDTRLGFGLLPTWPEGFFPLQTTLDHCLVSENIEVISRSTGNNLGSDHLPITVELHFN